MSEIDDQTKRNTMTKDIPDVMSPEKEEMSNITPRFKVAAGIPGIVASLRQSLSQLGVVDTFRLWRQINQQKGFDCPSCAWPDAEKPAMFEFCENGAKAVASEATRKRLTPDIFRKYSVKELSENTDIWHNQQGRLTEPMWLPEGADHYQPVTWEAAYKIIADALHALPSPHHALFYTSGRTSNEAAFLYQLFAKKFGTNNLPDCSNMCHESSGTGLSATIGEGKGTVILDDFYRTDLILLIGQNPGTNHPRMLTALELARKNNTQIVSINPLPETGLMKFEHPQHPIDILKGGTILTTHYLPVRVNGDIPLLTGFMKVLLEMEESEPGSTLNHDFIEKYTSGFEDLAREIKAAEWSVIVEESGIPKSQIVEVGQLIARSKTAIYCWAMGITQHKNSVGNVEMISNLALMRGHLGIPGAGLCPVRGHSNVQGDRTMGIWEKPTEIFMKGLKKEFEFDPPAEPGLDVVNGIKAMHDNPGFVFFGMGGNFLSSTPDTEYTAEALRSCRLTVHVSTKLNRSHLVTGKQALILPCLGRTEIDIQNGEKQCVTTEDSMSIVHTSEGRLKPASPHLRSEPAIICQMALAVLGEDQHINWKGMSENYDLIREHISHIVPGFEDFNRRVREEDGFHLPNAANQYDFKTDDSKAKFKVVPIEPITLQPGQLLLTCVRSHDQFNTTIYSLEDRYRGVHNGRRVIFMNVDDIRGLGFKNNEWVNITSHYESTERHAHHFKIVEYPIPKGCAAAYYPEINILVSVDNSDKKSNCPAFKSIVITLARSDVTAVTGSQR